MSVTNIKKGCQSSVLDLLENLLKEAKSGKISELVVLASNGSKFYIEYTESKDVGRLVTDLELIKHAQIHRMIDLD